MSSESPDGFSLPDCTMRAPGGKYSWRKGVQKVLRVLTLFLSEASRHLPIIIRLSTPDYVQHPALLIASSFESLVIWGNAGPHAAPGSGSHPLLKRR